MASIILTTRCNLHCPYCFASGFVNREKSDISITHFLQAVSFITRTESSVSLIGGEPTIHPGFQTIMDLLIANPRVNNVNLFTNNIFSDQYIPQMTHPKVTVIVNCNSPLDVGKEIYARFQQNLDLLFRHCSRTNQIHLGFNLYSDSMDYSYMLDLLKRYSLRTVRTSLTVPVFSSYTDVNVLDYFRKRKKSLLNLFRDLDHIQVMAFMDCNHPPYCIWTEEEKEWLKSYISRCGLRNDRLIDCCSPCSPDVTIYPDLQADRCYGMSDYMKVPISEYKDIPDLIRFFANEMDAVAYKLPADGECRNCQEWRARRCLGGCIGYKSSRIRAANKAIDRF